MRKLVIMNVSQNLAAIITITVITLNISFIICKFRVFMKVNFTANKTL